MKDAWRHFIAEFIGTFALVFIGGGAIITSPMLQVQAAVVNIAFAHGLILALLVTATMRISGHLNLAVTAGFLVTRRIEATMAVVYWIAQFMGAVIAAYALKALYPANIVAVTKLGGQSISADINLMQAIALEAIATFFLVFVVFGTAVDPKAPKVGGTRPTCRSKSRVVHGRMRRYSAYGSGRLKFSVRSSASTAKCGPAFTAAETSTRSRRSAECS